jgi:hypothetical protein
MASAAIAADLDVPEDRVGELDPGLRSAAIKKLDLH